MFFPQFNIDTKTKNISHTKRQGHHTCMNTPTTAPSVDQLYWLWSVFNEFTTWGFMTVFLNNARVQCCVFCVTYVANVWPVTSVCSQNAVQHVMIWPALMMKKEWRQWNKQARDAAQIHTLYPRNLHHHQMQWYRSEWASLALTNGTRATSC